MATNAQSTRIVIDQVGIRYRARIVKLYPCRSALSISPEKFLDGHEVDLVVLPGLFADRKTAVAEAEKAFDFVQYSTKQ